MHRIMVRAMEPVDDIMDQMMDGFALRIGLHETPLTRALGRGDFAEAERLILETSDPDYLNEGALESTPLSIVLGGSEHHARNLKLARLMLERGANPNLRIPAADMETASQSPLERLVSYYLKLIHVFGVPGSPNCRISYRNDNNEETELMDSIGINGEIGGLGPHTITEQTRELLMYCLERGGDPNLPTTDAAKTIFHLALSAPTIDEGLLQRMLELGANVNHADVHNTTPLMDVVGFGDEERALRELARLERSGRPPVLDSQNCSHQSVLWRAMFQGHTRLAAALVNSGATPALPARVEAAANRPPILHLLHRPLAAADIKIPPLLAPFLCDSPCATALHVNVLKRKHACGSGCFSHVVHSSTIWSAAARRVMNRAARAAGPVDYSISRMDHLSLGTVAPLVDAGLAGGAAVGSQLAELIKVTTELGRPGEVDLAEVVDVQAIVPLMFGQVSAGLRQLAVRAILRHALFPSGRMPERTLTMLDEICVRRGFTTVSLPIPPSVTSISGAMLSHEYILELGHEVELSFNHGEQDQVVSSLLGENIQHNPDLGQNLQHNLDLEDEEVVEEEVVEEEGVDLLSPVFPSSVEDQEAAGASATATTGAGGVDTDEFWEGLERLDREAWALKTDSFLASLDRESADLERRFWNLALEVLGGQNLEQYSLEERLVARQFWDLKQRRIQQLRERMRAQLNEMERQQETLDTVNQELQQMEEDLAKEEEEGAGCDIGPDLPDSLAFSLAELPGRIRHSAGGLINVREYPGVERTGEDLMEVGREGGDGRKQLDENWSLGPARELAPHALDLAVVPQSFSHTEMLVQSLDVSMNLGPAQPPPWLLTPESSLLHRPRMVTVSTPSSPLGGAAVASVEEVGPAADLTEPVRVVGGVGFLHNILPSLVRRTRRDTPRPEDVHDISDLSVPHIAGEEVVISSEEGQEELGEGGNSRTGSPVPSEPLSTSSGLSDSGSWGGPFSLRHVGSVQNSAQEEPAKEANVIHRLNPRVLEALTDHLGVPSSLRVCFALEVARLQLTLLLFTRQSITCDRNCEGDESDGDSEDEWADSDSDLGSPSDDFPDDDDLSSSESSPSEISTVLSSASSALSRLSEASAVSLFGSSQGGVGGAAMLGVALPLALRAWEASTPTTDLSPASTRRSSVSAAACGLAGEEERCPSSLLNSPPKSSRSSSSSSSSSLYGLSGGHASPTWLQDREDLCRMRRFLSGPVPPGWQDSTSSGEDEDDQRPDLR